MNRRVRDRPHSLVKRVHGCLTVEKGNLYRMTRLGIMQENIHVEIPILVAVRKPSHQREVVYPASSPGVDEHASLYPAITARNPAPPSKSHRCTETPSRSGYFPLFLPNL